MIQTLHPSTFIDPEWVSTIRNNASAAEQLGMIHPEQLALAYQQKWFKALVPAGLGGRGLTLPELVRLEEGLSWADGSFGWVVTLCSGAGWFAGFIDTNQSKEIFAGDDVCLAGSGAQTGEAIETKGGYIINGEWNYASGAHHATHFTINCLIKNEHSSIVDSDGEPLILSFILDKADVTLLPTWKYMGMVATGSHSFKIENKRVDKSRAFRIDAEHATIYQPLYKFPFLQLAEATLAANLSGMALHFIDLATDIINEKMSISTYIDQQKADMLNTLQNAKADIQEMRDFFYKAVDASWEKPGEAILHQVSKYSRILAGVARFHVDQLYPYCGLMAASPETEINRVWRDLHTASQHSLLTFLQ
jgi:alkylation response protein AidB-like acyl-CoA dehydrogenase